MLSNQQLGAAGELRARRYLEARGYRFVAANYRTRYGELDLVMRHHGTVVFVEVKTRRGGRQGAPEEAVTVRKLTHTIRAAEAYCQRCGYRGPWRIDVVALAGGAIRHLCNVTA